MPKRSATEIREEIDNALDGVKSLSALGLWTRMRRWIETSSHDGHLQVDGSAGTLERVAEKLGRSPDQLSLLVKPLVKRGLISTTSRGVFFSEPLTELRKEQRRQAHKSSAYREKQRSGVISPPKRGDAGVTPGVTGSPSSSLPHTPSLTPPPPEIPVAAQPAARRARKPTAEPMPGFTPARDAWVAAWSAASHGADYPFDGRDAKALHKILDRFGARANAEIALSRFSKLTTTYLGTDPPSQLFRGHSLYALADHLPEWIARTARAEKGIANGNGQHKPKPAERGEYVGPTGGGVRRLASQQQTTAAPNG